LLLGDVDNDEHVGEPGLVVFLYLGDAPEVGLATVEVAVEGSSQLAHLVTRHLVFDELVDGSIVATEGRLEESIDDIFWGFEDQLAAARQQGERHGQGRDAEGAAMVLVLHGVQGADRGSARQRQAPTKSFLFTSTETT